MTTLLMRTFPPAEADATTEDPAYEGNGFVDCRGMWQTLKDEEPTHAGS